MNEKKADDGVFEFTLRDFYFVLFRHKKKTLALFFFIVVAFTLYVLSIPDVYLSEAQLLVKVGRESLEMIPTADQDRAVSMSRNQKQDLYTEIEILKSRDVFEELVNRIGIESFIVASNEVDGGDGDDSAIDLSGINKDQIFDKIVSYLMKNIFVNTKIESNIIEIMFAHPNPEMAHDVVSQLIDIFIEHHMKIHYANNQYDFFNDQANDAKRALDEVEAKLAKIKNQLEISSITEYSSILLSRIESLRLDLDNNKTAFVESQSKINSLENTLKHLPETVEMERITGNENTLNKLYELQLKEHELLSKYSEDNFQVKEIRNQIKEAKKLLNDESQVNQGINSTYQSLQEELINEKTKLESLTAITKEQNVLLAKTKEELRDLNNLDLEISQLERDRETYLSNYNKYKSSLEEARIDQVVQQQNLSNIRILQPATQPVRPMATKKRRNLAMGLFMGLFGAVGTAIISEFLDHTIKRQEDIEKQLGLRTLAIIPDYASGKQVLKRKKITKSNNNVAIKT